MRAALRSGVRLLLAFILLVAGCSDTAEPAEGEPRLASLSPAVTSFVLAMGGRERLVAVSHYEADPAVADLPNAGDYLTVDWETLAAAEPTAVYVQAAADRLPAGLLTRASELDIDVRRVEIDLLTDAVIVMQDLLPRMPDEAAAQAALDAWREEVAAVAKASADLPQVDTLIVTGLDNGYGVAGPDTHLDDMLTIAGGTNAAPGPGYATLDAESLAATAAEVVIVLAPDGNPDVSGLAAALPAARVVIFGEPDDLLPGYNTAAQTRRMFDALHTVDNHAPTGRRPSEEPASASGLRPVGAWL